MSLIVLSAVVIILGQFASSFLFQISPEIRRTVLNSIVSSSSSTYNMVFGVASTGVIISLSRGFYRYSRTFMFNPIDLRILRPSPVRPAELYLAKYVRDLVKYAPLIFLSSTVVLPVMDYLRLAWTERVLALSSIAIFLMFLRTLEHLTFFLTRTLAALIKTKRVVVTVAMTMTALVFVTFIDVGISFQVMVVKALPSTLVTEIVIASAAGTQNSASLLIPFTSLLTSYMGLLAITLVACERYDKIAKYDEKQQQSKLQRVAAGLLIGRTFWNLGFWHDPAVTVALKDAWVDLRQVLPGSILGTFFILGGMVLVQRVFEAWALPPYIPSFAKLITAIVILALVAPFTPSLDSFTREPGRIWILKISPIPTRKIIYGKYLYALFTSTFTVAPLLVYSSLLLAIPTHQTPMILIVPHILLMSNAVGIYISAGHPTTSKEESISLGQYLSAIVLITVLTAAMPIGIFSLFSQPIAAFLMVTDYAILVSYMFLKAASSALKHNEKLL